ncbi:MAG: methyltransferase [Paludibacter sp.]
MSNSHFSFKQFTVYHDKCAMKVGIDGVLIGAWTPIESALKILDVGTGTGLIALMLAQRSEAEVTGIDLDKQAVLQAKENTIKSPWSNRVRMVQNSLQEFASDTTERFDLIVSNPPYFVNSTKTPLENRTAARHTDLLTHEELIVNALKLLSPVGRICLILPVIEGQKCIEFAETKNLFCSQQVNVYPKPSVETKRLLLEFSLIKTKCKVTELTIESEIRHQYSNEFSLLAKDFYLKL